MTRTMDGVRPAQRHAAARQRGTGSPFVTETVLVALACVPAALVSGQIFDEGRALVPLVGAIAVAALLGWHAARRLASAELVWVVGIVGGVSYGLAVTAGDVGTLVVGLRAGWPRLLAAAVPAQPRAILLVPLATILWVAAYLAVVLVARTENALIPVVPPLVALIGTLLLVGDADAERAAGALAVGGWRPSPVALTGTFVLLAMAVAALRAARSPAPGGPGQQDSAGTPMVPGAAEGPNLRRRPPATGTLAVALATVLAVALLATLIGGSLPVASRFDARAHVEPPVEDVVALNPLVRVRAQLASPEPRDLFTVRLTNGAGATPAVDPRTGKPAALATRVRIAALGDFTGASWRDDGRFVRVDRTLPTPPGQSATGSASVTVRADVTLRGLDGDLLPTLGQAESVVYHRAPGGADGRGGDAADLAFQASSGSLATLATPASGDRVELVTRMPRPDERQLAAAVPATGAAAAAYTSLPRKPTWLEQAARRIVGDSRSPYQQLAAIEKTLAGSQYPYDLSAPPGHSYGVLYDFLHSPGQETLGYAEQHAAAFAVLARALGFPTRIAVGYLLDTNREAADGTFTVTNWQAHAWPEVLLQDLGWVPFEATDTSDLRRSVPPQTITPAGGTNNQPPAASRPVEPPALDRSLDRTGSLEESSSRRALWWILVAVALAPPALVALALLLVVGEKARRRLVRSRGAPTARVRGAWREARDRLAEYGVPRSRALTHREVVRLAADTPATASAATGPLRDLLTLAEAARFGGGHATEPDAGRAWHLVGEMGRELRRSGGRIHAARAMIDPRPLLPAARAPGTPPDRHADAGAGGRLTGDGSGRTSGQATGGQPPSSNILHSRRPR